MGVVPPEQPLWARFSADPRQAPDVRASDADRDVATEAINAAFSSGRLDTTEHSDRLNAVLNAKRLGELEPLLADITVPARTESSRRPASPQLTGRQATWRTWILVTIVTNVVWLLTWIFSGDGPSYYWPVWPMLGMAIPVLIMYLFPEQPGGKGAPPSVDGGQEDRQLGS